MADSRLDDHSETTEAANTVSAGQPAEPTTDHSDDTTATPQQMVVRRAPKITPFLVTGGLIGVVIAFIWVAIQGPSEEYSQGQTLGFIAALLAAVGLAIASLVWLLFDRRSKRSVETVYARPTDNPEAADVAVTQDDYSEWSQFQQRQRVEDARREERTRAKAAAKAQKHNKRN